MGCCLAKSGATSVESGLSGGCRGPSMSARRPAVRRPSVESVESMAMVDLATLRRPTLTAHVCEPLPPPPRLRPGASCSLLLAATRPRPARLSGRGEGPRRTCAPEQGAHLRAYRATSYVRGLAARRRALQLRRLHRRRAPRSRGATPRRRAGSRCRASGGSGCGPQLGEVPACRRPPDRGPKPLTLDLSQIRQTLTLGCRVPVTPFTY